MRAPRGIALASLVAVLAVALAASPALAANVHSRRVRCGVCGCLRLVADFARFCGFRMPGAVVVCGCLRVFGGPRGGPEWADHSVPCCAAEVGEREQMLSNTRTSVSAERGLDRLRIVRLIRI